MKHAICTLFEGHYHLGVGALINSLHAAGFQGPVICGYRGAEPSWAGAARELTGGISVKFVPVATAYHLTYYKPQFMNECWSAHSPDAEQLYYFDPDIVLKAPWSVFDRWAADGIALCEDVNDYLPARHPYRLAWGDFLRSHHLTVSRPLDRYYNAGFLGLPLAHRPFLNLWAEVISCAAKALGSLTSIKVDDPNAFLHNADQDALNMALMAGDVPINGTGPEGMDFATGGHLMSHAIGGRKPWRGGFFRDALRGLPPGSAQKYFFKFAESPLQLFPVGELTRLQWSLRTGALLGRLYRRV